MLRSLELILKKKKKKKQSKRERRGERKEREEKRKVKDWLDSLVVCLQGDRRGIWPDLWFTVRCRLGWKTQGQGVCKELEAPPYLRQTEHNTGGQWTSTADISVFASSKWAGLQLCYLGLQFPTTGQTNINVRKWMIDLQRFFSQGSPNRVYKNKGKEKIPKSL